MATKSILLTGNFQLITNLESVIHLKSIAEVEYHTSSVNDATPADQHATIKTDQGFGYPGGDYLFMRLVSSTEDEVRVTVDEVA